jgi:hypothetical protein
MASCTHLLNNSFTDLCAWLGDEAAKLSASAVATAKNVMRMTTISLMDDDCIPPSIKPGKWNSRYETNGRGVSRMV